MTNNNVHIHENFHINQSIAQENPRAHTNSGFAGQGCRSTASPRPAQAHRPEEASRISQRKKRTVSRTPDMSNPQSRVKNPGVSLRPAARDVSLAEAKKGRTAVKEAQHAKDQLTVQTVTDKRSNPFPFSAILTTLFCTLLFMYMVYNYVEINEYSVRVKTLQKEITALSTQQKDLELSLSKRDDLTVIAERAEELGMVKLDEVQKFYISGKTPEKVEVSETAKRPGQVTGNLITDIMSALGQNFRQIAEYIR